MDPAAADAAAEALDAARKRFEEGEANAAEVATGTKDADRVAGIAFADWGAYTVAAKIVTPAALSLPLTTSPSGKIALGNFPAGAVVRIGATGLAYFVVTNTSDRPIQVRAGYNVVPEYTGPYSQKLQCFCFQDQTLAAGETRQFPVQYFIAPELATDREAKGAREITLSYTFYPSVDAPTGPNAEAYLDRLLACKLPSPGRARLAPMLGGIAIAGALLPAAMPAQG